MSIQAAASNIGCTLYTFVSRRAAGVWTHLPSLTYALLDLLPSPNIVVWVDFGLRYEMFNHFRVDAYKVSPNATLLELMAKKLAGHRVTVGDLTSYDQIVCDCERQQYEKPLSAIQ